MSATDPGTRGTTTPTVVRVVSWNCNGGLAKKAPRLLALRPDIAVVPECAKDAEVPGMVQVGWTGEHLTKGLGVYARQELDCVLDASWDPERQWFLPVRTSALGLRLLAVWAMHHRGSEPGARRGRIHRAIDQYAAFIAGGETLVVGDFNDNLRWDTSAYPSWARTTEMLAALGLANVHYARSGETLGAETTASFYWRRKRDAPYLIDHAFLPTAALARVRHLEVGSPDTWLDASDHMPLVLDLAVPAPRAQLAVTPEPYAMPAPPRPTTRLDPAEPTAGEPVTEPIPAPPAPRQFRVATWNMNHWQQPVRPVDTRAAGWEWLRTESGADVALLQETVPPASLARDRFVYHDIAGHRPWGSAVVALDEAIEIEEIWSVASGSRRRYRLANTHPGSVAIARLRPAGIAPITAVSLYNVLDGHPTANLLRVVADLVPLLESVDGGRVILGGDLNVYRAVAGGRVGQAGALFALLDSLGLHAVGELDIARPASELDCVCGSGGACRHVTTWKGYELDHLFVTDELRDQVCALEVDRTAVERGLSDHAPLVVRLELSAVPVARAWDPESFTREMSERHGVGVGQVVDALLDWADRKEIALRAAGIRDRELTRFDLPPAVIPSMWLKISFREQGLNPQWLIGIHAKTGNLNLSFQYMWHPPFDNETGREPLRALLNAIDGVDIPSERLRGRPTIPLRPLEDPANLERVIAVLDRIVDETRPTATPGAVHEEDTPTLVDDE